MVVVGRAAAPELLLAVTDDISDWPRQHDQRQNGEQGMSLTIRIKATAGAFECDRLHSLMDPRSEPLPPPPVLLRFMIEPGKLDFGASYLRISPKSLRSWFVS